MAIEDVVRPALPPPEAPGFRPAPTRGANADTPTKNIGGAGALDDAGPYSRIDRPQDYGRWPRLGHTTAAGHEIASAWTKVSGSYQIDPNAAVIWRLSCYSAALSLSFAAVAALPAAAARTVWATAVRVATVEIQIDWLVAAPAARSLTLSGVRFADGVGPEWTPAVGRDVLHVQISSDGDLLGFATGLDMRVPT